MTQVAHDNKQETQDKRPGANPSLRLPPHREKQTLPDTQEKVVTAKTLEEEFAAKQTGLIGSRHAGWPIPHAAVNEALLNNEWREYVSGRGVEPQTFAAAGQKHYAAFRERAAAEFKEQLPDRKQLSIADQFIALKGAFDKTLGKTMYNEAFDTAFDGILPSKDGITRLQCASGTKLLMALTRDCIPLHEGEKHVYVYTAGHMFPGVMTADKEVTAVETTAKGGVVKFNLDKVEPGMQVRVTDAFLDDFFAVMPKGERKGQEQAVLLDTVVDENMIVDKVTQRGAGAGKGEARELSSPYAFGKARVPSGDLPREQRAALSLRNYQRRNGNFARAGQDQGQPVEEQRRGPDRERDQGGGVTPEARAQIVDLEKVLSKAEMAPFERYFAHHEIARKHYNEHLPIRDSKTLSNRAKSDQLASIVDRLDANFARNGVVEDFRKCEAILERHGLRWRGNIHPMGLRNVIAHNCNYFYRKRDE